MTKIKVVSANVAEDIPALANVDKRCFHRADQFLKEDWKFYAKHFQFFWVMSAAGDVVGSVSLAHNRGAWLDGDLPPVRRGSLYLVGLAILPKYRGQGFAKAAKQWEIRYARKHGFKRMVTIARKNNETIVVLNQKAGFSVTKEIPEFWERPPDTALVMERAV